MPDAMLPLDGHLCVLGQTGLGKTAFVRAWVKATSPQQYSRILIADKDAEYGAVAVGIGSFDELTAYLERTPPPWRIAYQGDDLDDTMPVLCTASFEYAPGIGATDGYSMMVVEEADLWCNPSKIVPAYAALLKYGRKRGGWVTSVARRAGEIHRLATSQARHVIAFGAPEPIDADYVRRAMSGAVSIEQLQSLDPLEGAWWDRRTRTLTHLHVDPASLVVTRLTGRNPAA